MLRTHRYRAAGSSRRSGQRVLSRSSIVATIVGLSIATASTAPAQAADTCLDHRGSVACARQTNTRIDACDRVNNGARVRAHYRTLLNYGQYPGQPLYYVGPWDPNGAQPGCSQVRAPAYVVEYRLCEEFTGCSPWRRTA